MIVFLAFQIPAGFFAASLSLINIDHSLLSAGIHKFTASTFLTRLIILNQLDFVTDKVVYIKTMFTNVC